MTGIGENLFEVVHAATDSSTIVVDMRCDLRKMAKACAKDKASAVGREYNCTVGGTGQNATLMVHENLRFVGMPGSCIYSDKTAPNSKYSGNRARVDAAGPTRRRRGVIGVRRSCSSASPGPG